MASREFFFVDESGDPGWPGADPLYILIGMHVDEPGLHKIRRHITSFRYHHDILKEFKDTTWASKFSGPAIRMCELLAHMTEEAELITTANWLDKSKWHANKGPHLAPGKGNLFRAFQLRLLLQRHIKRKPWGERLDVVVDRWRLSPEQRRNLEDYLRNNYALRPVISSVTIVDSLYSEPIQIVDMMGRLARKRLTGAASTTEETLCDALMDLREYTKGLY
jgi:hypothetical protein